MDTCVRHKHRSYTPASWIKLALLGILLSVFVQGAICATEPTESECRPYIEKALKEQHLEGEEIALDKTDTKDFLRNKEESDEVEEVKGGVESTEVNDKQSAENVDNADDVDVKNEDDDDDDGDEKIEEQDGETEEDNDDDEDDNQPNERKDEESMETESSENVKATDGGDQRKENADYNDDDDNEDDHQKLEESKEEETDTDQSDEDDESSERPIEIEVQEIKIEDDEDDEDDDDDNDDDKDDHDEDDQAENTPTHQDDKKAEDCSAGGTDDKAEDNKFPDVDDDKYENDEDTNEKHRETQEQTDVRAEDEKEEEEEVKSKELQREGEEDEKKDVKIAQEGIAKEEAGPSEAEPNKDETKAADQQIPAPEEELTQEMHIPDNLRPRDHINKILRLNEDSGLEKILEKTIDSTLKTLKGLYDNAIKPLEMLYKYRDLSNRHFGDPEIFSKPLVLFMGPWSGGKSTTINYLLNNEFSHTSLRTGAEPSPAYFNILMHGEEEEILDGTQLAADWTFSGLQKFGQGLLDRLKGVKLPNKLLEKVNVVEIPGILEIRKQVQRLFPFNDACQWFIDRADIIFLVYDPSKLDVGPETEAILDQLKGRESQTRIILNKADQVKPEELMRVQGTLIWNISPLMSSTEPPIMYSTSLWSMPYEIGAPTRLLLAQERAFLQDLRDAIEKRVENKISSARRFAVRVRNHAKMVDCYLTTYYNHKSFFGNRKRISDDIIEHPQKYHIYEGLSTLTNISRYDLPDPEVYQDFFKINPLYEFKKLSETCTYFRGCPINKLDVVIAYDLPELIGKYRKAVEAAREQLQKENS